MNKSKTQTVISNKMEKRWFS